MEDQRFVRLGPARVNPTCLRAEGIDSA